MFSVVIPVHNKFPHLDRSILSVLRQTFRDFELILIDDASSDGSGEKLCTYGDDRIIVLHRKVPGAGGYAARNLGIKAAKYEWICFLDADDEWDLNYLQSVRECLDHFPNTDLLSVGWTVSGGDGRLNSGAAKHFLHKGAIFPFTLTDYLNQPMLVCTIAVSIRKSLLERVSGFPANGPWKNGGDVDTWIRCLEMSRGNIHLSKDLAIYYRDSINRVTDYKTNKTYLFCAYDSLMRIYKASQDSALKRAIRFFVNKNIYNILARQPGIEWNLITKMFPGIYSITRLGKLFATKVFK